MARKRRRQSKPKPVEAKPAPPLPPHVPAEGDDPDRAAAAAALEKIQAGGEPTFRERQALRRWQARRKERAAWQAYVAIPKKHWAILAGRQQGQLDRQAVRHGLPLNRPTIDLREFVPAFYDFLRRWAKPIADLEARDDDGGRDALAAELAAERIEMVRMRRQAMAGELVALADMRALVDAVADEHRRMLVRLEKRCGKEAKRIAEGALRNVLRVVERKLGGGS